MTASNELLVVHLEERVGGGEKLRVEYNLEREKERGRKREREKESGKEREREEKERGEEKERERERKGIRIKLSCALRTTMQGYTSMYNTQIKNSFIPY